MPSGFLGGGIGPSAIKRRSGRWYTAGGAPTPIAAYQPKGAASLAASYINLANPGTYDAAPGVAPTFDAATGWTFNGSTQYLLTGITSATASYSMIVRFSGARTTLAGNGGNFVCGGVNVTGGVKRFTISNADYDIALGGSLGVQYGMGASGVKANSYPSVLPSLAEGVLCIAGTKGYRNGSVESFTITDPTGTTQNITIGGMSLDGSLYANYPYLGNVQAVAIYNSTLTPAQVAAISAAMAAL